MKILRPGPRPFVALGTICGVMFLVPLFLGISTGKWLDAGKMAACLMILPILFFTPISFMRIEVDEDEIRIRNLGSVRKRVRFDAIGNSFVHVLAERDWPVSLTIIGKDGTSALMTMGLKVLRKEDVAWLLSLPQLKVIR